MINSKLFAGIDIGTQSLRILIADSNGSVIQRLKSPLESKINRNNIGFSLHEQDTNSWKTTFTSTMRELGKTYHQNFDPVKIFSFMVDGTSGTIIPIDKNGEALIPAIMYNDKRSQSEADTLNSTKIIKDYCKKLGYKFSSSFSLPKILWIKNNLPDVYEKTYRFYTPTDLLNFWLTGNINLKTDWSNALKMGYNLLKDKWPEFIETKLELDQEKFPEVVPTGKFLGKVSRKTALLYRLSDNCKVISGCTDGMASLLASGANNEGDLFFVLGTTLVSKAISKKYVVDNNGGLIYCYKHPMGYWSPGGASNTGTTWIKFNFNMNDLKRLDDLALKIAPSRLLIYPLEGKGERFPIINPNAQKFSFYVDPVSNEVQFADLKLIPEKLLYTGYLEGVGYVIRMIIDLYYRLDIKNTTNSIYLTGGGSISDSWMKIIANVTGKTVCIPEERETAYAGILMGYLQINNNNNNDSNDIAQIFKTYVRISKRFRPEISKKKQYDMLYKKFKEKVKEFLYP